MLEKPDLPDEHLIACLRASFGLDAARLAVLPLGADVNTAVYRAEDRTGTAWFVKLRRGNFEEASLLTPHFLSRQGLRQIIAPLETRGGQLWTCLDGFACASTPSSRAKTASSSR